MLRPPPTAISYWRTAGPILYGCLWWYIDGVIIKRCTTGSHSKYYHAIIFSINYTRQINQVGLYVPFGGRPPPRLIVTTSHRDECFTPSYCLFKYPWIWSKCQLWGKTKITQIAVSLQGCYEDESLSKRPNELLRFYPMLWVFAFIP